MKKYKFLLSQIGWGYAGEVIIKANEVKIKWQDETPPKTNASHEPHNNGDGDTIIADGVEIVFDEPFQFCGEDKEGDGE